MHMTRVLILGAYGQIARVATELFLRNTDAHLTLYLRNAHRLAALAGNPRVSIAEGDVLDGAALERAVRGQDVVYANLDGRLEEQAKLIVQTMGRVGVKRLIFISSMGIYGEAAGQELGSALVPYRRSAEIIEASDLDYTIIRPAWLNDRDEIDYGTTHKGEPFKNPSGVVSRKSVADLVVALATTPGLELHQSLGVHKGR
jgi:uncharacterized protein YbjT (DUF2867 family)